MTAAINRNKTELLGGHNAYPRSHLSSVSEAVDKNYRHTIAHIDELNWHTR